ncbi:hypothetical protein MEIMHGIN_00202 [Aeromonas phage avDM3]|nr:hypothetical protein MEIMHGIN_00202 [Aeromonas phage avDM3]
MNDEICVVCKQPVAKVLAVKTGYGLTHPGPCAHYAENLPLSESTGILEETELLV